MQKIKSSGQLRQFLLDSIDKLSKGEMSTDEARNIVKISGQINDNLYAEVKVLKTKIELGQETDKFGNLNLTETNN